MKSAPINMPVNIILWVTADVVSLCTYQCRQSFPKHGQLQIAFPAYAGGVIFAPSTCNHYHSLQLKSNVMQKTKMKEQETAGRNDPRQENIPGQGRQSSEDLNENEENEEEETEEMDDTPELDEEDLEENNLSEDDADKVDWEPPKTGL